MKSKRVMRVVSNATLITWRLPMKRTVVFLILMAILLLVVSTSVVLAAKAPRVDVCHVDQEDRSVHLINISGNAVDKHIENHSDWLADETYGCSTTA